MDEVEVRLEVHLALAGFFVGPIRYDLRVDTLHEALRETRLAALAPKVQELRAAQHAVVVLVELEVVRVDALGVVR